LVFDRFHVIKLYNDKLSDFRRAMYRELTDLAKKSVLKGVRWLLLKRPENLDPSRREPERLREALRLNQPLAIVYQLKEELNEIWEQDDRETAEALLMEWILVHPAEAYVDLKKCGHDGPIWSWKNDFRKEVPACPRVCCTMDLGCVSIGT
jgi:transposase